MFESWNNGKSLLGTGITRGVRQELRRRISLIGAGKREEFAESWKEGGIC
jgi:hypothetical protein